MKKALCVILALLTAFSLAACQSAPVSAPTETSAVPETTAATQPTETTTIPEETQPAPLFRPESILDQILLENNAVTVTFDTHDEYEKTLYEMGFFEYLGMRYRYTQGDNKQRLFPKQLTYDGENFRYEFDYLLNYIGEDVLTEGWVLYGTTSAEIIDLVPVPEDQIIEQHEFKLGMSNELFSMVDYDYFTETTYICQRVAYYVESQHLYALFNVYPINWEEGQITDVPRVLGDDMEARNLEEEFG